MKVKEIKDIFYSNFNANIDYEAIKEISDLVEREFIKIEITTVCDYKQFQKIIDRILNDDIKLIDYQGGENKHIALKIIAEKYIKNSFNLKSLLEANYLGRIPDLITTDKSIIFECGDTDPRKILEYFKNREDIKIYILPYPDFNQKELLAYCFSKSNNGLSDYLLNKQLESYSKIKEIFNKSKKSK